MRKLFFLSGICLVSLFFLPGSAAEKREELSLTTGLAGTPEAISRAFVQSGSGNIQELTRQRDSLFAKFSPEDRARRAQLYIALIQEYAPHWLPELRAISTALGWKQDDYLHYNILKNDKVDCTSWIMAPDANALGKMILHKNRDSNARDLAAYFRHSEGTFRWLYIGESWSYSPTLIVNEKGLVAVMNAGDANALPRPEVGFKSPDVLMLIAERCSNVDEAVDLLKRLVNEGKYSEEGTIFLLADPARAAILECAPGHWAAHTVTSGFDVRANSWLLPEMKPLSRMPVAALTFDHQRSGHVRNYLTDHKPGRIDIPAISRLSRSRKGAEIDSHASICRTLTVCGATFVPDAEFPASLTTVYLALGPVRNTIYLPVPLGANGLPVRFFNSRWGNIGFELQQKHGIENADLAAFEDLEKKLLEQYNQVCEQARVQLRAGKETEARNLLTANLRKQALEAWQFLDRELETPPAR